MWMKNMPLEIVGRADSAFDNYSGVKRVTKIKFRYLVYRFAKWYEIFTGTKVDDRWCDRVVEFLDLSLSIGEIEGEMAERADIPMMPEHYKPGMSLEEVEAPELVRVLKGTVDLSKYSSKMQMAAIKAWITMWSAKGEYEKVEFAGKILDELLPKLPEDIKDMGRTMMIPEKQIRG